MTQFGFSPSEHHQPHPHASPAANGGSLDPALHVTPLGHLVPLHQTPSNPPLNPPINLNPQEGSTPVSGHPVHRSIHQHKGDDGLAFDLELGERPKVNPGVRPEVKASTRHERWMERQAQKQGPWGEGLQGIHVLLWLIPISGGLGYAFILPWIHPWGLRLALYIIIGVLLGTALVCLYLVNQLDPGVVTPQANKDPEIVAAESGQVSRLRMDGRAQWVRPPAGYSGPTDVGTNIRGWERYCSTCNIWRGPRVTHCSICGYCMKRFDHHCAVVGTCIAQNNHRFFVLFLLSTGVGSALLLASSIVLLAQRHWGGGHAWSDWHTYFGLLLTFYFFYLAFLLIFGCCHLCLVLCDLTSKQMAQRRITEAFGSCGSCLHNILSVSCAPIRHKHHVIPPYNLGQPPPARILRAEHKAQEGLNLEAGKCLEENGWEGHEVGGRTGVLDGSAGTRTAGLDGPEERVAAGLGGLGDGRRAALDGSERRERAILDGSDDHVVRGEVALDPEARAYAEEEFQEEENERVAQVAHLGPLFPGM